MLSVNSIKAVVLLRLDGRRFIAKYFDEQLASRSKQLEKQLYSRTKNPKSKDGVLLLDGLVVHKIIKDLHIYVIGAKDESPCILSNFMNCLADVINNLDSRESDYKIRVLSAVLEDTVTDGGIIFEANSQEVMDAMESREHEESHSSLMRFMGLKS